MINIGNARSRQIDGSLRAVIRKEIFLFPCDIIGKIFVCFYPITENPSPLDDFVVGVCYGYVLFAHIDYLNEFLTNAESGGGYGMDTVRDGQRQDLRIGIVPERTSFYSYGITVINGRYNDGRGRSVITVHGIIIIVVVFSES